MVFNSWPALHARLAQMRALANGGGCYRISVDFSLVGGVATVPVGNYDLTGTTLAAYPVGGRLDFADGCSVVGMFLFEDFIDVRNQNTAFPLCVVENDPLGVVVSLQNNAGIETVNGGTQPFYDVATNSVSFLLLAIAKASRVAANGSGVVFGGVNVGEGFQSGAILFPQVFTANPVQPPLGGTHRPNAIKGAAGSILFPQFDNTKAFSKSAFPSWLGTVFAPQVTAPTFLTPNPFQSAPATAAVVAAHGEALSLNASGGPISQPLPSISGATFGYGFPGGLFSVNETGGGVVTLTPAAGDTINGVATPYALTAGGGVLMKSDGLAGWAIIAEFEPGGGGANEWYAQDFTPTLGQVSFILAQAPTDLDAFSLSVNGVIAVLGTDYTVSGTTLTWLNVPFSLTTSDFLSTRYIG